MSGTPNIKQEFITQLLTQALSKPEYSLLFEKLKRDHEIEALSKQNARAAYTALHGKAPSKPLRLPEDKSIEEFAAGSVKYAFGPKNAPKIVDPIVVIEPGSREPVTLYRVFDGNMAKTLGGWWCSQRTVQAVAGEPQFARLSGDERAAAVCRKLAQLMFVHPSWNECKYLAKMELGDGRRTVAIAARGDWQALNAVSGFTGVGELKALGMEQGPGSVQYFIPLINPMYVTKVPNGSNEWPLR